MISLSAVDSSIGTAAPSLMEEAQRERVRRIHAEYCGWQEGATADEGFHLWTLLHEIDGHPAGSTVTQGTLDAAIFS